MRRRREAGGEAAASAAASAVTGAVRTQWTGDGDLSGTRAEPLKLAEEEYKRGREVEEDWEKNRRGERGFEAESD